jgi:hypothetical protein
MARVIFEPGLARTANKISRKLHQPSANVDAMALDILCHVALNLGHAQIVPKLYLAFSI